MNVLLLVNNFLILEHTKNERNVFSTAWKGTRRFINAHKSILKDSFFVTFNSDVRKMTKQVTNPFNLITLIRDSSMVLNMNNKFM